MWLGNIADKLQQQLYQTVGGFVSDVQLIFSNSASYNRVRNSSVNALEMTCRLRSFHVVRQGFHQHLKVKNGYFVWQSNMDWPVLLQENAEFLAMGKRLKKLFDKEFKNVFNICQ